MPSADFNRAVAAVLQNEGGLSDNPNDPGGLTNFGISLRSYPQLGAQGIRNLTAEAASAIYFRDFWQPLGLGNYQNQRLATHVLDMAVNAGSVIATALLQRLAGVIIDGQNGPETRAAVGIVAPGDYANERAGYYIGEAFVNHKREFLASWLSRLPICYRV